MSSSSWHLGTLRQWHWVSSAVCLVGLALFSFTGITLNHAASIPTTPRVQEVEAVVPAAVLAQVEAPEAAEAPLPAPLLDWLSAELDLHPRNSAQAEWDDGEVYLALPRPGGDAWLSIDLESGELFYERTDRGWISYLNDLHKGRDTGVAWRWFIDVFAVACFVFSITGLLLLQRDARNRPMTWPSVALGLVIPLVLVILFIH